MTYFQFRNDRFNLSNCQSERVYRLVSALLIGGQVNIECSGFSSRRILPAISQSSRNSHSIAL